MILLLGPLMFCAPVNPQLDANPPVNKNGGNESVQAPKEPPDEDKSLEIREKWAGNKKGVYVENGSAYDKAVLELGKATKLVVPRDARVLQEGKGSQVHIFMKKTLGFFGHPPETMTLRQVRQYMGCGVKAEGDIVTLTTFGEWDSRIEGGARMRLLLVVPEGIAIEEGKNLSGPESIGQDSNKRWLTKPKEVKEGYWYGPAIPGEGWRGIPAVPDPDRRIAKR